VRCAHGSSESRASGDVGWTTGFAQRRDGDEMSASGISLRACVVGAGCSGLVTIKELLDEGHEVTCFEQEEKEGGNFSHPVGLAYDSMYLTVSQHFMAFSCYPPPVTEKSRYWTRQEYAQYLQEFALRFGLLERIRFSSEIVRIERLPDGGFSIEHRNRATGATEAARFDAVAICAGAFRSDRPRVPKLEGLSSFAGRLIHTAEYKSPEPFRGKRVLCIGFGETAADVATQVARVAQHCAISFRHYPSLLSRYAGPQRRTPDQLSSRLQHGLTRKQLNAATLRTARTTLAAPPGRFGPAARLKAEWRIACGAPAHRPFQKNDDFIESILSGSLQPIPVPVARLEEHAVVFADGTRLELDAVILCTGYEENSPPTFMTTISVPDVRALYKHMIHPDLGPRFAFIGWARPAQGGVPTCSEMQARYFSLLCSGRRSLPDRPTLEALIAKDRRFEETSFHAAKGVRTLCNYTPYVDSIAELIGCKPRLMRLLLRPRLLYKVLCASNVGAMYRLVGPHAEPELARRVILTREVPYALRTMIFFVALNVSNALRRLVPIGEPIAYARPPGRFWGGIP
jgi:cation diffusion facilitator CzcD-associated flavoprotein CzcO